MERINITLDVSKISKLKIVDRKYTNRNNEEVIVNDYKIEVIPLKEVKVVASGDTWIMKKTHFVVEAQTKEERASQTKSVIVGEGFVFESKESPAMAAMSALTTPFMQKDTIEYPEEDINVDDIPF